MFIKSFCDILYMQGQFRLIREITNIIFTSNPRSQVLVCVIASFLGFTGSNFNSLISELEKWPSAQMSTSIVSKSIVSKTCVSKTVV